MYVQALKTDKRLRHRYYPADTCEGQTETDEEAAMFIVEDGGSISNVVIGKAQGEGIHCRGAWYA